MVLGYCSLESIANQGQSLEGMFESLGKSNTSFLCWEMSFERWENNLVWNLFET